MIGDLRALGLITARGGSKGLPCKNIRPLLGKPLIGWTIEQAKASPSLDAVVVSTDSQEIAHVARNFGAEVPFLRPAALASDTASSADAIIHALDALSDAGRDFDIVVLLEPTSPLRRPEDVEEALKALAGHEAALSVVSVTPVEAAHPAFLYRIGDDGILKPFVAARSGAIRRQDLEPLHHLAGCFYMSYVDAFRSVRGFYHDRTLSYAVGRHQAYEIDELSDFIVVEALMQARLSGVLD
jgi:CMP-N,N'-diacetyllegionaminic acid synthase